MSETFDSFQESAIHDFLESPLHERDGIQSLLQVVYAGKGHSGGFYAGETPVRPSGWDDHHGIWELSWWYRYWMGNRDKLRVPDGYVINLDADTGSILWERHITGKLRDSSGGGTAYTSAENTCKVSKYSISPDGKYVYVMVLHLDENGHNFHKLDQTGETIWSIYIPTTKLWSATATADHVYVGTNRFNQSGTEKTLLKLSGSDGSEVWSADTGTSTSTMPSSGIRKWGSQEHSSVRDIKVDTSGNVLACGHGSSVGADDETYQRTVWKFNSSGVKQWDWPPEGEDTFYEREPMRSIETDNSDNCYVLGDRQWIKINVSEGEGEDGSDFEISSWGHLWKLNSSGEYQESLDLVHWRLPPPDGNMEGFKHLSNDFLVNTGLQFPKGGATQVISPDPVVKTYTLAHSVAERKLAVAWPGGWLQFDDGSIGSTTPDSGGFMDPVNGGAKLACRRNSGESKTYFHGVLKGGTIASPGLIGTTYTRERGFGKVETGARTHPARTEQIILNRGDRLDGLAGPRGDSGEQTVSVSCYPRG